MNATTSAAAASPATAITALVTGASSGIGLEMARLLAGQNCNLVLVSRRGDELERVAAELSTRHGVRADAIAADLGDAGAARRVFDQVRARGIRVDWLINNAGVGIYGDHTALDTATLENMLRLNVLALAELCSLFGADMRERRSGRILNIASTAAYQPSPYFAAYGASKSFVLNFSEALSKELEDYGVSVSCLSPGPTDTSFFAAVDAAGVQTAYFGSRQDPREVARIGVDLMRRGGLSRIVGMKNYLLTLSQRLSTRRMVAGIAKRVLRASAPARTTSASPR